MIGTFENFKLVFGSFGQHYSTIDGRDYITFFDLADPKFCRLRPGAKVEYEARPGPTVLCHSPQVSEALPSAVLVRVVEGVA